MTKQVRAARTRQALIRSAAIVFEQHGYGEARLALISSGAGVSTGALHFHFENKAAVAQAVVAEASHGLLEVSTNIRHRTDTALQTLVDTSHALVDLLGRDPVTRAGFRLSYDGERCGEPGLPAQWRRCVGELLDEAAAAGTLAEGLSRHDVTVATVAATTGFEVLGRHDSAWLSARTLTGFWHLLLPRLATPETLPLLDPSGTAAAGEAVAAGRAGHETSGAGAAAPS
ncbi:MULTISPECIES: ScbR family autoregulator-binding transcription factor [unclassified Streptomyces]|uniref:ScbR family autoregulator-binding transcription factor n=1 Tax=unclassified Streptomyces TaxID=2593676 RepID=UPI00081F39A8|nr:ScbR family autoregulator-binding transcription factor [Streptomyces sp. ScaeMP-e83]MYR98451.1 TetR family transcriptional regulator [Streptomyces sp. SID4937]SCE38087.1 transcriptional regulator, TetR family [Streptomyces sp. ScaeMP-e83]